jgi:hypothetical protein
MFNNRSHIARNRGCLMTFWQGLVICGLLIINGVFIRTTINETWTGDIRAAQAMQFTLPIVMIWAQFWLIDFLFARNRKRQT